MQFSTVALLAAAFANEALAGPVHQHRALHDRAIKIDNVIVTQEIVVTAFADGVLKTGAPKVIGVQTIEGKIVETTVRPVETFQPIPASAVLPGPVLKEQAASPEPSTTTVQVSSAPVAAAPVVATTFATSVSVAPAPVVSSAAAPVVSSSEAPSPSPVASTPATTGGKRGVAYNDASFLQAFTAASSVSWCYNWGPSGNDVPEQFEFVPMLWGTGSHANNWKQNADAAIASGSKHLLAFNEPDHWEQANISPSAAADGYRQYMQQYAGKVKLGSPAVTNGGGDMGLTWLKNFMNACSDCTIDFIAIHWYNGGDAAAFKTHVQNAYQAGGNRPVWITEWQAPGSTSDQVKFLAEVLPWLDSQDWIQRHSLFMAAEGNMMAGTALSDIGKAFVA